MTVKLGKEMGEVATASFLISMQIALNQKGPRDPERCSPHCFDQDVHLLGRASLFGPDLWGLLMTPLLPCCQM